MLLRSSLLFLLISSVFPSLVLPFAPRVTIVAKHGCVPSDSLLARASTRSPMIEEHLAVSRDVLRSEGTVDIAENVGGTKKVAVLICPAQFCVPVDYEGFVTTLKEYVSTNGFDGSSLPSVVACKVAPLPRTEWIKVAKNLPTRAFIESTLPVYKTLDWYFKAMEDALFSIFAEEGDDVNLCIIGHSIGGWVARAYLGGLSGSTTSVARLAQKQCTSFITLGTPHVSPEVALLDQTRGLLKEVGAASSCTPNAFADRGIDVTCVGSASVKGKILTTNVEEIVAATSYFPLLGRLDEGVKGDGIVPTELAFMDAPARRIEIDSCSFTGNPVRHAHVLPTPWNLIDGSAPSLPLPKDFSWYGSLGVIEQWAKYIR